MYDDTDIDRVARRMIHELGAEAADGAAAMVEQGGPSSQLGAMWAKILARIEELRWKGVYGGGS